MTLFSPQKVNRFAKSASLFAGAKQLRLLSLVSLGACHGLTSP